MKFQLAINLERMNDSADMRAVRDHTLEMVRWPNRAGSTSSGPPSTTLWR